MEISRCGEAFTMRARATPPPRVMVAPTQGGVLVLSTAGSGREGVARLVDLFGGHGWTLPPVDGTVHALGFSHDARYVAFAAVNEASRRIYWVDCVARTVSAPDGPPLEWAGTALWAPDDRAAGPSPPAGLARPSPLASWFGAAPRLACACAVAPQTPPVDVPIAYETATTPRPVFGVAPPADSQVVLIDPATGRVRPVGAPACYEAIEGSANGRYLLLRKLVDPGVAGLPPSSWGRVTELWSVGDSTMRLERVVARASRGGVASQARWHPFRPATLVLVRPGTRRHRVVEQRPPFDPAAEVTICESSLPLEHVTFTSGGRGLVYERDAARGIRRLRFIGDGAPGATVLEQPLGHGGRWQAVTLPCERLRAPVDDAGRDRVIAESGGCLYVSGTVVTVERHVPFLDAVDCDTLKRTRVWTSKATEHEAVVAALDRGGSLILTRAESPTAPPHYRVRDLATGTARLLEPTDGVAETRDVYSAAPEHLLEVADVEGPPRSAVVFRPARLAARERAPALVWIHPTIEALQREPFSYRLNRYLPRLGVSPFALLEHGVAVVPYPMMPIAGDPTTMADTFLDQLIAGCRRVVRLLAQSTCVDTARLVVGGHCFGAYAAALLLTRTDLFAAGIGISGMYNLASLQPGLLTKGLGFEAAPDLCARLSPICHVDKLRAPFLIVHGSDDVAPTDYVAQGRQMFNAMATAGAIGRLMEVPGMRHDLESSEAMVRIAGDVVGWCTRWVAAAPRSDVLAVTA